MSEKTKAIKNLAFSSLGVYVESFFMMIMSVIIARTLGPDSYGIYALILWACALSLKIINGGVTTALIKYIAECRIKYPQHIASSIKYLKNIQSIKLFLVVTILSVIYFATRKAYLQEVGIEIVILLLVAIALRAVYMFNVSVAKGFENFKASTAIAVLSSPIHLLIIIICALLFSELTPFIVAYTFSALIYFFVSRYVTRKSCAYKDEGLEIDGDLKSRILKHSKVVMINTLLLFFIANESELIFLKYFSEPEDLGMFKVAHRLSLAIAVLLPGIFDGIMLPLMSGSIATSKDMAASRFIECIKYISLIAIPSALFFAVSADEIIYVLYGYPYSNAILPFVILVSTCCICSITSVPTSYLLSIDKQYLILKVMIVGTVIKLILDYYLIYKYSLVGAAIAFSITFFFMFFSSMVIALSHLKVRYPWKHFAKIIIATSVSYLFIFLIPDTDSNLFDLLISGTVFFLSYLFFSLLLNCWRNEEVDYIREKLASLNIKILKPVEDLFKWVSR